LIDYENMPNKRVNLTAGSSVSLDAASSVAAAGYPWRYTKRKDAEMNASRLVPVILTVLMLFTLVGCSEKPANSVVEAAVRQCLLEDGTPGSWIGQMGGGQKAEVELVSVEEWGSYNKDRSYWPVKIHVVGSAISINPFNKKRISFDEVAEFRLRQDDYGEWEAMPDDDWF